MVPIEGVPPVTDVGEMRRPVGTAGVTVNGAVAEEPEALALMVTCVAVETPIVEIVKVAVFDPPATVTVAGTIADGSLLVRETDPPVLGAGSARVTVPTEVSPLTTAMKFKDKLDTEIPLGAVPRA